MATPPVHVTVADSIARVELDKPPVNALDLEVVQSLADIVTELGSGDVRAVVFSGRGSSLAAGGDVKWMHARATTRDKRSLRMFFRAIQRVFDDIERLPMPTVAAVRGFTLGGGLELALACDLRVAADDAKIGFPEATLGLLPAAGGSQRLADIVGRGVALELLYTGRIISAADAHRLGLVNRVVAPTDLEAAVDELVAEVVRSTPAALSAAKDCVLTRLADGRNAGFRREGEWIERLAFDPDAIARLTDFMERSEKKSRAERQPATAGTAIGPEGAS